MFGNKDAGLMETLLRFRSHDVAKAPWVWRKSEDLMDKTPIDVLVRKETYFAVSHSSRWNQ